MATACFRSSRTSPRRSASSVLRCQASSSYRLGTRANAALSYAENVKTQLAWRTRDLSPPVTAGTQPEGTGGAADFLGFITQELKPFIASRYAVDPEEQTLPFPGRAVRGVHDVQ